MNLEYGRVGFGLYILFLKGYTLEHCLAHLAIVGSLELIKNSPPSFAFAFRTKFPAY